MNNLFEFTSAKDWDKLEGRELLKMRSSGLLIILIGSQNFMHESWGDFNTFHKVLFVTNILAGIFTIINPDLALKPFRRFTNKYLIIDSENIKWHLGRRSEMNELRLKEIVSWKSNVGEVYFETKDGKTHRLEHHKISSKLKHTEFIKFLKEDFNENISKAASLVH